MSRYEDNPLQEAAEVIEMAVHCAKSTSDFEMLTIQLDGARDSVTALLADLLDELTPVQVEAVRIIATHVARRAALTRYIRQLPVN